MKYALTLAFLGPAMAQSFDIYECATRSDRCNGPGVSETGSSSGTTIEGGVSGSNVNINGVSCPGSIYNSYCCIGDLTGPVLAAQSSSLSSQLGALSTSLGAAAASRSSALASRLSDVPGRGNNDDDDDNDDFDFVRRAQVTTAPVAPPPPAHPTLLRRDATEIYSGVTCLGQAVRISASDYSARVSSASSARKDAGDDWTKTTGPVPAATETSGGGSGSAGGSSSSSDDGDDSDSDSDSGDSSSAAAGQASSSNSDGAAPRVTAAAVLVGGVAGAVVFGAM